MIHALALFASHLFDLAGFWNEVRESLTLAKRRMASRSSRLAPTFVLGDLVFLSSKVYIFTCVTNVLVYFPLLINGLTFYKLEHHRECNLLFGCNCDMLSKASIDQNKLQLITSLMLQWALGLIAVVPIFNVLHIFFYMTFLSGCYWNKNMFMSKYVCLSYQILFFDSFSKSESMLTFDLNTFEYMLS